MCTNYVDNSADILDSRDVIKRLEELEDLMTDFQEEHKLPDLDLSEEYTGEKYDKFFKKMKDKTIDAKILKWDEWEELEEYKALKKFAEELEGYAPDWNYGATLIRESYWVEYCKELVSDIGDIPDNLPAYIENNIDWKGVADDLSVDYTEGDYCYLSFALHKSLCHHPISLIYTPCNRQADGL